MLEREFAIEIDESAGLPIRDGHVSPVRRAPPARGGISGLLTWAQRLKRVFASEIETCGRCGGRLRVIASIGMPAVIERILGHLGGAAEVLDPAHPSRGPPQRDLPI